MELDVNHVQLHTASVELKMITVNQRQMTLSVFRQIPEKRLIDLETLKLCGVPWGWVNYFWPEIELRGKNKPLYNPPYKINVVWQKEDRLYRFVVFPLPLSDDATDAYIDKSWMPRRCIALRSEIQNAHQLVSSPCLGDLSHLNCSDQNKERERRYRVFGQQVEGIRVPLRQEYENVLTQYNRLVGDLHKMDQLFIAVGGGGKGQ